MQDTTPDHYGYGTVEDEPFQGNCATFDEAVAEGFDLHSDAESIWICEGYAVKVRNFVHADGILDNIAENAADEVGEVADDWLHKVPNEKSQELKDLIATWIETNYPPRFWLAKNSKQVFRKDYPELPQLPED